MPVLDIRDLVIDGSDEAGLDLLGEHAAAPGLEEVGRVARLHLCRDLVLERGVLEDGEVDLDVRVLRHVVGHGVLDERLARIDMVVQVVEIELHLVLGDRAARCPCAPARMAAAVGQRSRASVSRHPFSSLDCCEAVRSGPRPSGPCGRRLVPQSCKRLQGDRPPLCCRPWRPRDPRTSDPQQASQAGRVRAGPPSSTWRASRASPTPRSRASSTAMPTSSRRHAGPRAGGHGGARLRRPRHGPSAGQRPDPGHRPAGRRRSTTPSSRPSSRASTRRSPQADYDLLLCTTHSRHEQGGASTSRASRTAWSTACSSCCPRACRTTWRSCAPNAIPFVLIDHDSEAPGCTVVNAANRSGTSEGIAYLIGLGHRRIGFITGRPDVGAAGERLDGYRDALAEAGLAGRRAARRGAATSWRRAATRRPASSSRCREPPTAIFASSDAAAFGVLGAARDAGLDGARATSPCSGFDDIVEARLVSAPACPPSASRCARWAASPCSASSTCSPIPSQPAARVVMETELVVRRTTAPPRHGASGPPSTPRADRRPARAAPRRRADR